MLAVLGRMDWNILDIVDFGEDRLIMGNMTILNSSGLHSRGQATFSISVDLILGGREITEGAPCRARVPKRWLIMKFTKKGK